MRQLSKLAAAAMIMIATGPQADPAAGVWQTEVDDGGYAHVRIAPCGTAVCGVIARTFDENGEKDSPLIGRQIVINMIPQGGGSYTGQVWRPSNDKIYNGKMTVNGNQLALQGCVAGGLICASQSWVKVP